MRVQRPDSGPIAGEVQQPRTGEAQAARDGRNVRDGKEVASEIVVVDPSTRELAAATGKRATERSQRLAALKAEIDSGTYEVDYDRLAGAILGDEVSRQAPPSPPPVRGYR